MLITAKASYCSTIVYWIKTISLTSLRLYFCSLSDLLTGRHLSHWCICRPEITVNIEGQQTYSQLTFWTNIFLTKHLDLLLSYQALLSICLPCAYFVLFVTITWACIKEKKSQMNMKVILQTKQSMHCNKFNYFLILSRVVMVLWWLILPNSANISSDSLNSILFTGEILSQ